MNHLALFADRILRTLFIVMVASFSASALLPAQEFFDDFEAYVSEESLTEQSDWETWNNAGAAADGNVSSDFAASGENSLMLSNAADIVMLFSDITSGIWSVKANWLVSSEQMAITYFLLLNTYAHNGTQNWSVQVAFDAAQSVIRDELSGAGGTLPLVFDEWMEIQVIIDFDADSYTLSIGGAQLVSGASFMTDGQLALECIDLYSDSATGFNATYVDDVQVTKVCAPLIAKRITETEEVIMVEGVEMPFYESGDVLSVSIELSDIREDDPDCPELGDITITEALPEGWTADNISDGGTFADGAVTWSFSAEEVQEGVLTYTASGPVSGSTLNMRGEVAEAGNSIQMPVAGTSIFTENGLRSDGVITSWLLLGPFQHAAGSPPAAGIMQQDHLTDGEAVFEESVMPKAGDSVDTDYTAAASTGLAFASWPDVNPEGIPAWYPWREKDTYVDLDAFYGAVDSVVCYAVCYVCVEEEMTVVMRAGSDDGIQVIHDDTEVWINPVDRAWGGFQDIFEVELHEGVNRIMAKVFESGGGWNFGVKITDSDGAPLTEGLFVTLDPQGCMGRLVPLFKRGDANVDGSVNIADAVTVLNYFFAGGADFECFDSGDANDDGSVNIADAVAVLGYVFGGLGPLDAPFDVCGEDPTEDSLDCVSYPPCEGE